MTALNRKYKDYDYLKKLNPEEKQWLKQFTSEYYDARFIGNKDLHSDRRECYNRKNAQQRDLSNRNYKQENLVQFSG